MGRLMSAAGETTEDKIRLGFQRSLSRPPHDKELQSVVRLYEKTFTRFNKDRKNAELLATVPLGPIPQGEDVAELAAWTVVGNVLLNLDEMLMKR